MIKVSVELVPPVPSNYSNDELARHVRHHFPNLSGPLLTLLERFEGQEGTVNAVRKLEDQESKVTCPHCGTEIQIDLELES